MEVNVADLKGIKPFLGNRSIRKDIITLICNESNNLLYFIMIGNNGNVYKVIQYSGKPIEPVALNVNDMIFFINGISETTVDIFLRNTHNGLFFYGRTNNLLRIKCMSEYNIAKLPDFNYTNSIDLDIDSETLKKELDIGRLIVNKHDFVGHGFYFAIRVFEGNLIFDITDRVFLYQNKYEIIDKDLAPFNLIFTPELFDYMLILANSEEKITIMVQHQRVIVTNGNTIIESSKYVATPLAFDSIVKAYSKGFDINIEDYDLLINDITDISLMFFHDKTIYISSNIIKTNGYISEHGVFDSESIVELIVGIHSLQLKRLFKLINESYNILISKNKKAIVAKKDNETLIIPFKILENKDNIKNILLEEINQW